MFKKKVMRKVKFGKKLKLWRLRESVVKEEFPEEVNNKCGDNEDWRGLKRKLLDAMSGVCGIRKANPGSLKHGGGIKMWMWLCVENHLGFGNRVGMRKIERNIVRQKNMLRQ